MRRLAYLLIFAAALLSAGCSTSPAPAAKPTTLLPASPSYIKLEGLVYQLAGLMPRPTTKSELECWATVDGRTVNGPPTLLYVRVDVRGPDDWTASAVGLFAGSNSRRMDLRAFRKETDKGQKPALELSYQNWGSDLAHVGDLAWAYIPRAYAPPMRQETNPETGQTRYITRYDPPTVHTDVPDEKTWLGLLRNAIERQEGRSRLTISSDYWGNLIVPTTADAAMIDAAKRQYVEVYGRPTDYTVQRVSDLEAAKLAAISGVESWPNQRQLLYGFPEPEL